MQVLATALFAVLLVAVRAPDAIDAAVSASSAPPGEAYSVRLPKAALANARIAPAGRDVNPEDEGNESQWNQLQTWHKMLARHAAENEEAKNEEDPKKSLQELPAGLEALMLGGRSMLPKEFRDAAIAQVERLRSQRSALLPFLKVPEPLKKLMQDPQIRKDALQMALGLAGLTLASTLWYTPTISQTAGMAMYVTALLSLIRGATDMANTIVNDPTVRESLERTSAAARAQVSKLLNVGRLQGEKGSPEIETD